MWVIPNITVTPTPFTFTVVATSNTPVHLWLLWSTTPVPSSVVYKTVRGITLPCGRKYRFPLGQAIEQQEPGQTFTHTFTVPNLECATDYAYAFTESPTLYQGVPALGPLPVTTLACPTVVDSVHVTNVLRPVAQDFFVIFLPNFISGNPAMYLNEFQAHPLATAQYRSTISVNIKLQHIAFPPPTGLTVYQCQIFDPTGFIVLAFQQQQGFRDDTLTFSFTAEYPRTALDNFYVRIERISGPLTCVQAGPDSHLFEQLTP